MKNATYGTPNQGDMILKRLQEEHGYMEAEGSEDESLVEREEQHEQNVQSFAEPPPPEPEVSACSIDENQLLQGGDF